MFCIQKHIDACHVPVREPMRRKRGSDCVQVAAINGHIHIPGQPGGHRVQGIDVQKDREAAHNAVGNARALQRRGKSLRDIKDLFHGALEDSVGEHGFYLKF
jgi:hypothetical protein